MNEADIEKLMSKFEQSNLQEMKIDNDGTEIYFSKLTEKAPVVNNATSAPEATQPTAPANTGNYKLLAPMVGLVYFAPSPDKPAYKNVGDHVKKGDTVCAIEAMKLINEVKSPVSGTIVKRLVSDGDMVEYNEPLLEIKED